MSAKLLISPSLRAKCTQDYNQVASRLIVWNQPTFVRCLTISAGNITLTNEYRSGVGNHGPFLSDSGRIVQKGLDIAEYTDACLTTAPPRTRAPAST
jgi:hypothetical protein